MHGTDNDTRADVDTENILVALTSTVGSYRSQMGISSVEL